MPSRLFNAIALREQSPNPRVRSTLRRSFLVYAGLILLTVWAYAIWYIASERSRAMQLARDQLSVAVAALGAEVEAMLGDGVGSARAALHHLQRDGAGLESERATEYLRQDLPSPEYIRALFLSDETRTVLVGRNGFVANEQGAPEWLANGQTSSRVRIGTSIPSPTDATRQVIPFAVKETDASGRAVWTGFLLGLKELNARHRRLGIEESVIALIRSDGVVVAYTSNRGKADPQSLKRLQGSELFQRIRDSTTPAVFEGVSTVDGMRKIFAVARPGDDIPLIVSVSREVSSVLASWQRSALNILLLALGSSIALFAMTALIYKLMREINERETQFQRLFDNSLTSILMIKNGRIVACNSTAARVFHAPDEHALEGLTPADLSPERQPDGTISKDEIERHQQILLERGAISFRWVLTRLDGASLFDADVHLSNIRIGEDAITLAIVHDISELQRTKRELQEANIKLESRVAQRTRELETANARLAAANRELELFSATASHDLRAPLGTISGQAGLLELELPATLGANVRERLTKIGAAVKRAANIVDGLLALARITREDLQRDRVSLSTIAEQTLSELKDTDPNRELVCRIDSDMCVQADARLMQSLLSNLLSNAWKYSGDKPQTVIEVTRRTEGDRVIYRVSDNGMGFDMQQAGKIFDAFERLPGGRRLAGVGLGLAIVARIVERYDGHVWVEATEGHGASFFFTLPAAEETRLLQ